MKEIHLLPENLLKMPSVGIVNNLYATSFEEVIHFEKVDVNETTLDKWVDQAFVDQAFFLSELRYSRTFGARIVVRKSWISYRFCQALVKIRNRHTDVVQTMAQGVLELKESHDVDIQTENSIQYFLDRFFMSRISIRMLINQHSKFIEHFIK